MKRGRSNNNNVDNRCMMTNCGITFDCPGDLFAHVANSHPYHKNIPCSWANCGKSFSAKWNFECHMRTHTHEKPFECDVCGMAFSNSGNLKIHIRTHTGERPFRCDVCKKSFSTSSSLTTHKRTHTGEKIFRCDVCVMAFTDRSTLRKHKRTHTGERPFTCDVCKKSYSQSNNLTTHKRTHTGERPFRCDVCGMAFSQLGHLKGHKQTHERPFRCDYEGCGKAFSRPQYLNGHKRTHTGPFCSNTDDCVVLPRKVVVAEEGNICGYCAIGYKRGVKEFTVFEHLAEYDWRLNQFVRDEALKCGTLRRPDGYVDLHVETGSARVLFVVEVDEFQHRGNSIECEIERLHEIQDRHGGAIYVIRYNPDQPGGLEKEKLDELAELCVNVLDKDHEQALNEFDGIFVNYQGYTTKRVDAINSTYLDSQQKN